MSTKGITRYSGRCIKGGLPLSSPQIWTMRLYGARQQINSTITWVIWWERGHHLTEDGPRVLVLFWDLREICPRLCWGLDDWWSMLSCSEAMFRAKGATFCNLASVPVNDQISFLLLLITLVANSGTLFQKTWEILNILGLSKLYFQHCNNFFSIAFDD